MIGALVTLHLSWKLLAVAEAAVINAALAWAAIDELPDGSSGYTKWQDFCGLVGVVSGAFAVALLLGAALMLAGVS